MPFRDDRDALLARADALQRELESTKAELDDSDQDSAELRAKIATLEEQLDKQQRRVAKLEKRAGERPDGADRTGRVVIAGIFAVLAGLGGIIYFATNCAGPDVEVVPVANSESPAALTAEENPDAALPPALVVDIKSLCLDTVDHQLRAMWRKWPVIPDDPTTYMPLWDWAVLDDEEIAACRKHLATKALPEYGKEYRQALEEFAALVLAGRDYWKHSDYRDDGFAGARRFRARSPSLYAAFITASDRLRADVRDAASCADQRAIERVTTDHQRHPSYQIEVVKQRAMEVMDLIARPGSEVAELVAASDHFELAYKALRELLAEHPRDDILFLQNYVDNASLFLAGVKELRRAAERGTGLADAAVASAYLALVRRAGILLSSYGTVTM